MTAAGLTVGTRPRGSAPSTLDAYDEVVAALCSRRRGDGARGLTRVRRLCALLGEPQRAYPAVQISGTNGKTSVARMVASVLQAHGVATGCYTSPHLQDLRERIRVDGRMVGPAELLSGLDAVGPHVADVESRDGRVTFFELVTALAYRHFARAGVDAGVFEVGVGGRRDPTNLADGRVAVLTRVGLDHAELGRRVEQVAAQKAGIIKDGALVVCADQEAAAGCMIRAAARAHGARLVALGRDFGVVSRQADVSGQRLRLAGVDGSVHRVHLPVRGAHQADNAACALAAAQAAVGDALRPDAVRAGLGAVLAPGRMEVFRRATAAPVLLDGAHNPPAARRLAAELRAGVPAVGRGDSCVVVLGVSADKDVDGIVRGLSGLGDHLVLTRAPCPRAASPGRLRSAVRRAHAGRRRPPTEAATTVTDALRRASDRAGPRGLVVVTGSLYLVGAARTALGAPPA